MVVALQILIRLIERLVVAQQRIRERPARVSRISRIPAEIEATVVHLGSRLALFAYINEQTRFDGVPGKYLGDIVRPVDARILVVIR